MAIQKRFGGGHGPHGPPLGTPLVSISELVISNSLDVLVLTETWLKHGGDHDHVVGQLLDLLPDYEIINQPRILRGGGLADLSRLELTTRTHTGAPYASFEYGSDLYL